MDQLLLYALGYKYLTGNLADFIEIYNLDSGVEDRRTIRLDLLIDLERRVIEAGSNIRKGIMDFSSNCTKCDYEGVCPRPNTEESCEEAPITKRITS